MKRVIEFPLEGGGSVLAEVEVPEEIGGTVRAGREDGLPQKAAQSFEQALSNVRPAAETIVAQLSGLGESLDSVTVEFGLKLSAVAGAFIASASTEANYRVIVTWKPLQKHSPSQVRPSPQVT